MPEVIIDGVRYVPARESHVSVREAVAREIAALYWDLRPAADWEREFAEHMGDVHIVATERPEGVLATDLLDRITARLAGG